MTSFKCFFDFSKEEAWLADMARQGYRITKATTGYYKFDKISDNLGEFTFKVDYRYFRREEDFREYYMLFEDSGWQHIAGTKRSGSQYFVKIRSDASDDIFSDNFSRAGRYKRIASMWFSLAIAYTPILIALSNNSNFYSHGLYLTPGLWEKTGWNFVSAFLFETPFALFRLSPYLLFGILIINYLIFAMRYYYLYKKELNRRIS